MPTVGIIGGIAPASTIEYYQFIVSGYLKREKSGNYPQIMIKGTIKALRVTLVKPVAYLRYSVTAVSA
ncbi:hypothetical protein D0962_03070 [Leptolyngbyaceae cyanobacterium CCMR0082]|uniref:Uncharacterized protein n=2 Tax=Adonisia turfae TaxID=2950184 RepID=A0A6M0RZZ8_9CYAN|nr:hypothetical protein [Adonisia turfae]MDV3353870.1 hypothetical protein [Leptothoe sp. LEGE 181152]NEZ54356.1 hypothetical protein [Adonisia turfae CCMR0081]NEZ61765.1 hypothetical protein [Adonisia turfae CCMR0082]